jgi:membrane-bound inhibitor of C-type lysozyme
MIKIIAVLGLWVLAGCGDDAPSFISEKIALKCGSYDVAIETVDADTINTAINGEKIEMHREITASGAKYTGDGAVVSASMWNKGEDWTLIISGRSISCKPLKKG